MNNEIKFRVKESKQEPGILEIAGEEVTSVRLMERCGWESKYIRAT